MKEQKKNKESVFAAESTYNSQKNIVWPRSEKFFLQKTNKKFLIATSEGKKKFFLLVLSFSETLTSVVFRELNSNISPFSIDILNQSDQGRI